MPIKKQIDPLAEKTSRVLTDFTLWLERYGETSWDHQSYYAGPYGRFAKGLYYKNKLLGTAAVAPMVFSEAFFPAARRLFHHKIRLPIADAHYAMGFAFFGDATADAAMLKKAEHFLQVLVETRCPQYQEFCWGYPFDWVWRRGISQKQTPLDHDNALCVRGVFADAAHPSA